MTSTGSFRLVDRGVARRVATVSGIVEPALVVDRVGFEVLSEKKLVVPASRSSEKAGIALWCGGVHDDRGGLARIGADGDAGLSHADRRRSIRVLDNARFHFRKRVGVGRRGIFRRSACDREKTETKGDTSETSYDHVSPFSGPENSVEPNVLPATPQAFMSDTKSWLDGA